MWKIPHFGNTGAKAVILSPLDTVGEAVIQWPLC